MTIYRLTECRKRFNEWANVIGLENKEIDYAWFGWRAAWRFKEEPPTRDRDDTK